MKELKLISSNSIIGEIYQDFNIPGSEWVHKAKRWVARGIETMGISGYFEKGSLWQDIAEYSAPLPCDLRVLGVILVETGLTIADSSSAVPIATAPAANYVDADGNTISATVSNIGSLLRLPLSNSLVVGKAFNNLAPHQAARGYISHDRLHTNFEEGKVLFVYYKVPVDDEGFPMVPDYALSIEALNYWIIYKMSLGGYKHPVIDFKTALTMWNSLYPQAKNRINYPSLEEMQGVTAMLNNPIMGDWANELYFS